MLAVLVVAADVLGQLVPFAIQAIQAQFVFPLPYDGAIDRLTFMVDGKEYDAKLLEKDKARLAELEAQIVRLKAALARL